MWEMDLHKHTSRSESRRSVVSREGFCRNLKGNLFFEKALRRGKESAINRIIYGNLAKFDPVYFYVRTVGGLQNYLC